MEPWIRAGSLVWPGFSQSLLLAQDAHEMLGKCLLEYSSLES